LNKTVLNLKVLTGKKRFGVIGFDALSNTLKVACKAKPVQGKANKEIEENLSKKFHALVKIFFGKKSSKKKIIIEGKKFEEIKKLIK
jgi:uncharacterized protein (TIGR00251 family)